MEVVVFVLALCSSAAIFLNGQVQASPVYNVMSYGATAMGGDDSRAFWNAWQAACVDNGARGVPMLYVPGGRQFVLKPIAFSGPCRSSSVIVKIDGNLNAPRTKAEWGQCFEDTWLTFSRITNLIVEGSGTLDSNGVIWWKTSSNKRVELAASLQEGSGFKNCYWPTALRFSGCNNLVLTGLHNRNSPRNHISISGCNGGTISNLYIEAPETSPNTDGIDISTSSNLNIHDLTIRTGDDCIAINLETYGVNITRVTCGPGHGISIGSLGIGGTTANVRGIHTRNCTFVGSQNGARIKTWAGGSGSVSDIVFADIVLVGAQHPIIIDQFYCPHQTSGCGSSSRNLKISGVTYSGFRGTSATQEAINFRCSNIGCSGIVLNGIDIGSADAGKPVTAVCQNARGSYTNVISPRPMCPL